jgi:hypothetical protein
MPGPKRIEVRRLGVMSEDAEPVRVQWGSDLSRTQISRRAWWKDWLALTQATRQWMAVLDHRFHETARIQRVVIRDGAQAPGPESITTAGAYGFRARGIARRETRVNALLARAPE